MTYEKNNIGGGAEHPGSDEQKISQMLGGLKRVEAPKDFDLHLKARIANARPDLRRQAGFLPILKYAVPLGLFLAVGAGTLFYNSFSAPIDDAMVNVPVNTGIPAAPEQSRQVTDPQAPTGSVEQGATVASSSRETRDPQNDAGKPLVASAPQRAVKKSLPGTSRNFTRPPGSSSSANSTDMAVGIEKKIITPPGMSALKGTGVKDLLGLMDAEAVFDGGSWVVRSVKSKGIADQMGLRAGDKLKTINGLPVGERTEFQTSFSTSTVEVERDGTTVELGGAKKPE